VPFFCEGAKATFIRLAQVTARILLVASETDETLIDVNDADDGFARRLPAAAGRLCERWAKERRVLPLTVNARTRSGGLRWHSARRARGGIEPRAGCA
jgi:hypothetical protein